MSQNAFHNYIKIWVGQLFSILGSAVVQFSFIWYVTITYQNPVLLSVMAFIGFAPQIVISPLAGILVDRYNRKLIIIIADASQAFVTLVLIIAFWYQFTPLWLFYVIIGLRGLCQAFHSPVVACLNQSMIPPDKYSRFNGLNGAMIGFMQMLGPIMGSFLLVFWSIEQVLWVDIITFIIAIIPLLIIGIPTVEISEEKKDQSIKADFSDALRVIQQVPGLLPFILLALILNFLFMPFDTLLPFFIKVTHSGSATELAYVMAALQAGMIGGALIVILKKKWPNIKWIILVLISVSFIAYLGIAISPYRTFWLMMMGGLVMGLCTAIVNPLFQTVFQLAIPNEYFGRVSSILQMLSAFAIPLGMIISGPNANWIGIVPEFIIAAIIGIISPIIAGLHPSMKIAHFEQKDTKN
jgi:DHA3 family macrolide efflux protein-like MFS transporter